MKPTYSDLENDIREMEAAIEDLACALVDRDNDIAQARDKLAEAIDLVLRLYGASVRDLDSSLDKLLEVLEITRAAL